MSLLHTPLFLPFFSVDPFHSACIRYCRKVCFQTEASSMNNQTNQIAQYKNATKLLNKKCQALEAQLNGRAYCRRIDLHRIESEF